MDETGEAPGRKSLPQLVAETLELLARYVREQAGETLQKSIVRPLQVVAGYVGLAIVAAFLAGMGVVALAIGAFQALAALVGSSWAAWLIVAAAYLILAAVIVAVRVRFKQ